MTKKNPSKKPIKKSEKVNKTSPNKKVIAKKPKKEKTTKKLAKKTTNIKKATSLKKIETKDSDKKAAKKTETEKTKIKDAKKEMANKIVTQKKVATEQEPEKKSDLAKVILAKSAAKKAELEEEKAEPIFKFNFNKNFTNNRKVTFKIGDYAIYPSHGIGKITGIEKYSIAGQDFSCYLMDFEKEKLSVKIPVNSAARIGLRHLISKTEMDEVFVILRSGVKKLKGMWSRRAQEYETKINSGDITLLAEVLRDLTRDIEDSERSYSERIIYETAVYRLACEYSAIYGTDVEEAKAKIINTAKDKLNVDGKIVQKDEFDDFDDFDDNKKSSEDEDDEDGDDDEDEDVDDDYDYDEDDKPKKKSKK